MLLIPFDLGKVPYTSLIVFLWAGMILGVALEAWAKFKVPNLPRAFAFSLGQVGFYYFQIAQMLLLLSVYFIMYFQNTIFACLGFLAVLTSSLLLQIFYLYPGIKSRADMIIKGENPPSSMIHAYYVFLELFKVCLLVVFGLHTLQLPIH